MRIKGFVPAYMVSIQVITHHQGESEQDLKQKPQRDAAYNLHPMACLATFLYGPGPPA